jgi:hypothetical protein
VAESQPGSERSTVVRYDKNPPPRDDDWERKQAIAGAMADFLEGLVVRDICSFFRTMTESVYCDTFEHRLLKAFIEADGPQSLQAMAARCGVSRALMLPEKRLRRVVERMIRSELVVRSGPEDKPRYALNRRSGTGQLLLKVFGKQK